jgi:hypothetical protein
MVTWKERAREERSRRKGTYTYICLCRKFPRLSCGDKSAKRHATIKKKEKNNLVQHTLGPVNRKQGGEGED